ncbi:MAG: polysaccharide biosynthesis protein [Phycisphaeraceae bacterium]|nr:MAG: polysaccharide biosynthesis protein [Phycisphaeraceae bacterium]
MTAHGATPTSSHPGPGHDLPGTRERATGSGAASARRAVLIGTAESVGLLSSQLALLADPPKAEAVVLVEPPAGAVCRTTEDLPRLCRDLRPDFAVVCLPRSSAAESRRVSAILAELNVPERRVPVLQDLLDAPPASTLSGPGAAVADARRLLGREPRPIDHGAVASVIEGKRVLVTGAGGSIGSEIARIVASYGPESLVLAERSENALFEIDRVIQRRFPGLARAAVLHDITDHDATLRLLAKHRPHAVFHAAAHKHVPLMEDHPAHAVTNNVFGTRSVADAALACGAERFVLISSDKAVNPTSVMGATKRLAEMYVQHIHRSADATRFSIVRFGNVLGSACSVVPIWSSQLAEGGPVTVTDHRMTRYFMSIHEAASLVIQSAAIPDPPGGRSAAPVFVLDMGEPVRILDLARRFVAASGFHPVVVPPVQGLTPLDPAIDLSTLPTMEIALTGVRPGEKLYEELAYDHEALIPSPFPGISVWSTPSQPVDIPNMLAELTAARNSQNRAAVIQTIRGLVPEMQPPIAARGGPLQGIDQADTCSDKVRHAAA